MIQADRRGNFDLITHTNGIYSAADTFLEEITGVMAKYGYSEAHGIGTDVGVLAERLQVSGVNVSCGYSKEHTDKEYTVIDDLQNCLNFIEEVIRTVPLDKQYEIHIDYKPYTYFNTGTKKLSNGASWTNDYLNYGSDALGGPSEDENEFYWCNRCKDFDCMNCPHYM